MEIDGSSTLAREVQEILSALTPLVLITLLGYFLARQEIFEPSAIDGLARFVFLVAIPAMLFHSLATGTLPEPRHLQLLLAFYPATWIFFLAVAWVAGRLFSFSSTERGIYALGATFGNTVFVGIPFLSATLGEAAMLPLFLLISLQAASLFLLVGLAAAWDGAGERKLGGALQLALRRIATDPIVMSLAVGLAVQWLRFPLPAVVEKVTNLLGQTGQPCALFVLGASLQRVKLGGELSRVFPLLVLKNLLHPALIWLVLWLFFELDPLWARVALLTAALPAGVNTYLLAERYGALREALASTVLLSTLLSLVTLLAWSALPLP